MPPLSPRADYCVAGGAVAEYVDSRERVGRRPMTAVHPCPGARPGETIAAGPGYRWIVYVTDDVVAAACYADGRLLRRDLAGWWTAGPRGQRHPVADRTVAAIVGTAPDGWPVLDEQAPLLGAELLADGGGP
ncbi:hypothetical protein [Iamia sp.]|uniref:hypothetical protein n=1 Tax=Iamia sp. TaxID=2722710 RepID=UPI002BA32715|nr:hypothetical protein [Iamia sp.]HXH57704.1 hypothetical protein [Iamia sp.]